MVDALTRRLAAEGRPNSVRIIRSVVRDFYADRGVKDEASYLQMDAHERRRFQLGLYDYYLRYIAEEMRIADVPLLLCERSVFDHYAYAMYGIRELMDGETLLILNQGIERFSMLNVRVLYLPYPTPWDKHGSTADGFRAREPAKDAIVDALIFKQLSTHRRLWAGTVPIDSPEARAQFVLNNFVAIV